MHQTSVVKTTEKGDAHVSQLSWHDEPVIADKSLSGGLDSLLSVGRERDVGAACVPAIERPLGLTVTDNEDSRR